MKAIRHYTAVWLMVQLILNTVLTPWVLALEPIEVDSSKGKNTQVYTLGSGTSVVDIASANGAGFSDNYFRSYSVPNAGVVVNNNVDSAQASRLGGYLGINQNLNNANGAATTILFQITGTGQTVLEGPTEIYGQRANFMVANPNGIYVNGGGFYNAPRVTLTTGQPILNQGQLEAIHVAGGTITVGPGGLLALPVDANVDSVELLARGIKLNGAIYADQATLVAGRNAIDYVALGSGDPAVMMAGITPLSTEGDPAPSFAIDSSQLGGMYANAIRMVSTEGGVGVRFQAKQLAQSGSLFLDANGTIQIADTGALVGQSGVSITGESVVNDGVVLAGDVPTVLGLVSDADGQAADLSITATGTAETDGRVDNTGYLLAGGDLTIEAERIANTGALTTVWLDYDEDAQTWHRRDTGERVEVPDSAREWRDITDTVTGATHRYYRDTATGDWVHAETGDPLVLQMGEWVYYDGAWRDPDTYDAMDATGMSVAWDDTTYTASAIEWVDTYTPAVIQSGQAMVLDGAVTNELAEIEAGNTLTITGALTNTGHALEQTVAIDAHRWAQTGTVKHRFKENVRVYSHTHHYQVTKCSWTGCWPVWRSRDHYKWIPTYYSDPLYSWVEDPIVHNATRERTVHQGDVVAGTASGQWLDVGRLFVMAAPGSEFMYQLDADYAGGAGPYTVDSSYFMTQYGSGVGQRLGDAVFEYLQLRQQYWQAYGEDLEADELRGLYDAAVLEGQKHGFIVGQALTLDQQAALDSDIIWLVYQTVNGEPVLAPQLFVANPSASPVNFLTRLAGESVRFESDVHNSASVFGQSVQLTGASVANTGRIRGGNTVSATLDRLDNRGKIIGQSVGLAVSDQLANAGDIQAEDGLTLSGGAIQNTGRLRGDTVAITDADTVTLTGAIQADTAVNIAVNGDLVVDVVTDTSTDGTSTHTEIRQRGLISGQSVDLRADGHITSTGGVIQGGDSVSVQGDEGVELGAVEQSHESAHATSISHTGTQLTSGGSAMIQSFAGDVVIQASDVAVIGDMTVDTAGDLAITSLEHDGQVHGFQLQDVSHGSMVVGGNANLSGESIAIRGESVVAGGSMTLDATDAVVIESVQKKTNYADSDFTLSREEQVNSTVQSGGDLSVHGRTVGVHASDVVSNGSVSIKADDSVTIESESNTFFSKLHHESSGSFGAKKSKTETVRTRDTVQSNIVGNGVTIESGKDTRIKGSTVQSAGDLSLKADGGIQILNDWDVAERHVEKSETGMGHASGQSHTKGSASATVVGSALVADGAVAVDAGESVVMQGSAIAGDSVDVTAETGVAIVSAENQTQTVDHKKRNGAFGYKKVTKVDTLSVTQTGSAVDAGTDVTVAGGDFLRVAGSSIQSNGQVDVAADTIRVEAVEERETRREYEMKQTMGSVKGVFGSMGDLTEDEQIEAGTQYNQNIHETIRDERTMKGSVIAGAGGVRMTAGAGTDGTVDIVGSDVVSEGDINLSAGGDVTITAAAERLDVTETEQDLTVMVGVVAGNAYVDAANTVGYIDEANRQLRKANQELKRLESLRAAGKASDRAIELAKANVAVAAANVAAATAQVAKAAKKAANTASTYGFYGEGLVRTTGTERKQEATTIRHRGSAVLGETVTIASGATAGVQGSAVKAKQALRIQAKDVEIESVADSHTHTDKTRAVNGEVRFGDDTSGSLTQSDSKTKRGYLRQVVSQVTGQSVAINAEEDLTIAGGVVRGETVAVNAGGDVTVRSMVDVDTMEHTNQSATVGTGMLGGSMGYATHRSERVGTVSSITGESVVVEADGVAVVGGVIAATDAAGADTGELTLKANRLTVSDVALKTESERLQLGGRTVGSGASVPAGESHATGQTTVSLGYGKYDRLDRVTGTIGNGTVEVGNADALDDVNRDVTQVRETVSETDGGSFDASLTVDHRVFSQTGRSEMGNELKELPGNYGRSVRNVVGMPHYARNMLNDVEKVDKKDPEHFSKAGLHQMGVDPQQPNVKYISHDGHHEKVINHAKKILEDNSNDAKNMGTYNYFHPDKEYLHGVFDIVPWYLFGNSPHDTTSIFTRHSESKKAKTIYDKHN